MYVDKKDLFQTATFFVCVSNLQHLKILAASMCLSLTTIAIRGGYGVSAIPYGGEVDAEPSLIYFEYKDVGDEHDYA